MDYLYFKDKEILSVCEGFNPSKMEYDAPKGINPQYTPLFALAHYALMRLHPFDSKTGKCLIKWCGCESGGVSFNALVKIAKEILLLITETQNERDAEQKRYNQHILQVERNNATDLIQFLECSLNRRLRGGYNFDRDIFFQRYSQICKEYSLGNPELETVGFKKANEVEIRGNQVFIHVDCRQRFLSVQLLLEFEILLSLLKTKRPNQADDSLIGHQIRAIISLAATIEKGDPWGQGGSSVLWEEELTAMHKSNYGINNNRKRKFILKKTVESDFQNEKAKTQNLRKKDYSYKKETLNRIKAIPEVEKLMKKEGWGEDVLGHKIYNILGNTGRKKKNNS